jgi:predicted Zn-dependent protease
MNRATPLRRLASAAAAAAALALFAGCQTLVETVTETTAAIGEATGNMKPEEIESIRKAGAALAKTFEDLTPEQEYWIGRSVAATVMGQYRPADRDALNQYVNLVGQSLAFFSDRPETFRGYHFLVLDSDDINAFAAPGGLIFVTRGMLRLCRSEDALAAVFAHEIGHVQGRHGLRAIDRSRLTSALTVFAVEGGKHLGSKDLAEVTKAFEGSIGDVSKTLMNSGYSRALEAEADAAAVTILRRAGYDPWALIDMLTEMKKQLKPGGLDFAKTHPDPAVRVAAVRKSLTSSAVDAAPNPARNRRFEQALRGA